MMRLLAWLTSARNVPGAGVSAPDFELPDQNGKLRSLGESRGRWLVLYFFLRADTRI